MTQSCNADLKSPRVGGNGHNAKGGQIRYQYIRTGMPSSVPGYFDTAGSKSITGQLQRVTSVNWDVRADTSLESSVP